jgi:hypothetical protein
MKPTFTKVLPILLALVVLTSACNFKLTVDGQTVAEGDPCSVIDGSGVTSPLCAPTATATVVTGTAPAVTDIPSSTPTATPSLEVDNLPLPSVTPEAFAGYTLNIAVAGEFAIPSEWSYVYCTNSTPELSALNGLQYTESDPLGSGKMWIGYAAPGTTITTFEVSQELLDKMVAEANGVALWCEFK